MNGNLLRRTLFPSSDQGADSSPGHSPHLSQIGGSTSTNGMTQAGAYMQLPKGISSQHTRHEESKNQFDAPEPALYERVRRARQDESQRSRLALGSRLRSPDSETPTGRTPSTSTALESHTTSLSLGSLAETRSTSYANVQVNEKPSGPRFFSHTKPSKSLRQRLDLHESQELPSYNTAVGSGDSGNTYAASCHDGPVPRAQSRSVSVLSSAHGMQDDDIPSIMMRGATDLRNAKFEIEEQRREIVFLHGQVESTKREKDELAQRLKAVKEAAKQSIQSSSKSLEALRTTIDDLKSQSEASLTFTNTARASLADVQELRNTTTATIKNIESFLDPNEASAKSAELRNVIHTLESDCSKSQQVADLLRDRLQSVGGDLIETKTRVMELETAQSEDRTALSKANAAIASTTAEVSSLVICLNRQQTELHDALAASADYEAKLTVANERTADLQDLVTRKDEELVTLKAVQCDNSRLQAIVNEKDIIISALRDLDTENAQLKATVTLREIAIAELKVIQLAKETQFSEYQTRVEHLEKELEGTRKTIQQLSNDLGATNASNQAAAQDKDRLLSEQRALQDRISELEAGLSQERRQAEIHSEKSRHAEHRFQVLEERFEDQSVTLRITRESLGDAQDRLIATETAHVKTLTESTAGLERELSVLHEQKQGLQATMHVMEDALKRQEASSIALKEEHAARLKQQESTFAERVESEELRFRLVSDELVEARTRITTAEERNRRLEDDVHELRNQLRKAQVPSSEIEAELRMLRSRVAMFEGAEMKATLRAKTIDARYRVGDLSDEEKAFINTLVQTSQTIHEQELVANRNELRRRDNALKEMRSKVHLLEATLAKHINAQKTKALAPQTVQNGSMIDPTAWISSGQSSSPVQAPDRDGQATNTDTTTSAKLTPAPNRSNLSPVHVISVRQTPVSKNQAHILEHNPLPTIDKPSKKPNFSRLATDCSDEILDFDDNNPVRRSTPPSSLGKRDKSGSEPSPVPMEVEGAPKALKRLRPSLRRADVTEAAEVKKPLLPSGSKNRGRKRR